MSSSRKWIERPARRAAARRQIPDDKMNERVIPNRDRAIRLLTHHVFRIGEAFLETVDRRHRVRDPARERAAGGRHVHDRHARSRSTASEVIAAPRRVVGGARGQVRRSRSCRRIYGPQPLHSVLERSTWHSAQHARQLAHVLESATASSRKRPLTPGGARRAAAARETLRVAVAHARKAARLARLFRLRLRGVRGALRSFALHYAAPDPAMPSMPSPCAPRPRPAPRLRRSAPPC